MTNLTSWRKEVAAIDNGPRPSALERAQELVAVYHRRNQLLQERGGTDLFANPAWHMLLDLFIAARTGKQISVSSLCITSLAPQTTALRHISGLVEKGLILRTPDAEDSRRIFLSLSGSALAMMEATLG